MLALAAPACGDAGPQAAPEAGGRWPAGTVIAVDDVPIGIDEVDEASVWVERVDPKATGRQLRRLALTNVNLPRAIAEVMAEPGARAAARKRALEALARLRDGTYPDPPGEDGGYGEVVEGSWQTFGLTVWGLAMDFPVGEWSEPIEEPGRYVLVRLLERRDQPHTAAIVLKIDALPFPYLPEEPDIEGAKDRHEMTIVDPDWYEIVPERTQYRMGVHSP